jgi:protocatechuate 3,4-dioxygenase beta subunit
MVVVVLFGLCCAPCPAWAGSASISGIVRGPEGQPLSGAQVSIDEIERSEAFGASTEPDGSYTVSGLSSGVYTVSFSAPGDLTQYYRDAPSARAANELALASGAALTGIDAELQLAGAISGTVTDASGAPLDGIFVTVFDGSSNVGNAETAADGTYSVASLPTGSYSVKFAAAPQVPGFNPGGGNYLPQFYDDEAVERDANHVAVVGGATTSGIDARLASGATVSGTVTDSSNAPVRGMLVTAYDADGRRAGSWFTDANGHYAIDQLPSGSYALEFAQDSANGPPNDLPRFYGGRTTLAGASAVSAVAGSETEVDEQVTTGGQVTGTVTDAEGHGVRGARVELLNAAGETEAEGQAGLEGAYDIDALESGTYFAEFLPPFGGLFETHEGNYLISFFEDQGSLADAKPLDLATGSTITGIDGSLPEGAELTGTVTGTGETPLANIAVTAYDGAGEPVAGTLTAANGTYTIGSLTTGAYRVRFAVEAGGRFGKSPGNYAPQFDGDASSLASATPVTVTVGAPAGTANAQMRPGASISGTVTNAAEEPVGNKGVDVYDEHGAFVGSASTAANGTYTVPDLAGGSYRVGFADDAQGPEALNYAPQFYASEPSLETATPVSVPAGEEVSGIDARLTAGGTIEGTLSEEESGAPPTGRVLVQVYDEEGKQVASVVAQANGSYSVGSLANGTYEVGFEGLPPGEGYAPTFFGGASLASASPVHVTAGQVTAGVAAEIERTTGSIAGAVTDAGGQGIGAQVVAYDEHGDAIAQTSTAADGSYAIAGLLPGFYRLCFTAGGYASACDGGAATLAQTDAALVVAGAAAEGIDQQMAVPGEPVATSSTAPTPAALVPSLTPSGGSGVLGSRVTTPTRPLTQAQKRARALASCAKLKSKRKRAKCVAAARRRYPLRKRRVVHGAFE